MRRSGLAHAGRETKKPRPDTKSGLGLHGAGVQSEFLDMASMDAAWLLLSSKRS